MRAVVIAAKGAAFSAGHDLKELTAHRADADGGRSYTRHIMESCSAMMLAVAPPSASLSLPPWKQLIQPPAPLVATCDLAVASTIAKFCTPGVHIGLFCSTPMVALSRNVARKHAMEMLLTGDTIAAEEAYRMGLVNRLVEARHGARRALRSSAGLLQVPGGGEARQGNVHPPARNGRCRCRPLCRPRPWVENMMARDAAEGIWVPWRSAHRDGTNP